MSLDEVEGEEDCAEGFCDIEAVLRLDACDVWIYAAELPPDVVLWLLTGIWVEEAVWDWVVAEFILRGEVPELAAGKLELVLELGKEVGNWTA